MRQILIACALALAALAISLAAAWAIIDTGQREALHNPYWPFTVEVQVRDN